MISESSCRPSVALRSGILHHCRPQPPVPLELRSRYVWVKTGKGSGSGSGSRSVSGLASSARETSCGRRRQAGDSVFARASQIPLLLVSHTSRVPSKVKMSCQVVPGPKAAVCARERAIVEARGCNGLSPAEASATLGQPQRQDGAGTGPCNGSAATARRPRGDP